MAEITNEEIARIRATITRGENATSIIEQVANGDINTDVQTASGLVPSILKKQKEWDDLITDGVYKRLDYAAGITLDIRDTVLVDGGDSYILSPTQALPYTTTGLGMPEGTAFVYLGDHALREELVQPVATYNSAADMKADGSLIVGRKVRTLGYYTPGDGGGNDYEIVAAATGNDDGGSFIDLSGSGLQAKGLFVGGVRLEQFGVNAASAPADVTAALLVAGAFTTGTIDIGPGAFTAQVSTTDSDAILAMISRVGPEGTLTVNLDSGEHSITDQVVINNPYAKNISIIGANTVATTATSQVSVSGSAKNYSVIVGVASSAGIAVNDYVMIRQDVAGTGDYDIHAGVWKVTAVDSGGSNRLTLLNTCHKTAFPTNTLTGGAVVALKTRLKFGATDGFRFEGGESLKILDKVAIVGDYNIAAATGTHGTHGIVSSSPVVHSGASSNADYDPGGFIRCGNSVGISGWGEQGVAISGRGNMVANFIACSSNRKRGIYAEGGHIRCKFATCSGNGEDGFIADTSGFIQAALSIASGNGLNGYWSTNNSFLNASNSIASNNLSDGFECRGLGRLGADVSISRNNGGKGFNANDGGMIDADSAQALTNTSDGFLASSGGIIDCDNAVSTGNGGWGYEAEYGSIIRGAGSTANTNTSGRYNNVGNSVMFNDVGSLQPDAGPIEQVGNKLWNLTLTNYYTSIITSVGDNVFSAGTTNRFVMKADGTFHPSGDNTQSLGRSANRWSVVYAGTGTINTSDEREKTPLEDVTEQEQAAALELKGAIKKFKFLDAVEKKGDGARIHFGVGAQTVKAIMEKHGLVAEDYALLCYDEWEKEVDDEGNVVVEAGNRYGVRYEELLSFIISSI